MKSNRSLAASVMLLGLGVGAGQANALELWEPILPGVSIGMPAGALPPPGVYGVVNTYSATLNQYDKNGNRTGVGLDALVVVPIVMWQTGVQIFGADYAVAIAQPFDYTNLKVSNVGALSDNGHWGTFNTVLVPGMLSWHLPNNFHVKAGLYYLLDNASSSPGNPPSNGGVGSGNGYSTLAPNLGISWLSDGWNISANMFYDYNFKNNSTNYQSGQTYQADYTVAKSFDNWTIGMGAFQVAQLTADSGSGADAAGCPNNNGCKASRFSIGPFVGYQFGGISLNLQYNYDVYVRNAVGGNVVNLRMVIPFN